jgi:hypothetical protein
MLINSLVMTIISATAWACLFPEDALVMLAKLKRQLRLRVIRRHREAGVRVLKRKLVGYSVSQGIDPLQVEEILAEKHDWLSERLGSKAANEILGEVDPSEGCY